MHALRLALACAGAAAAGASATASAGAADERCANAFVLEQIHSQYSAGSKAGRFLVYEFAPGSAPPQIVFSAPALVIGSTGLYLCERGLFASVAHDVRLKPLVDRLVIDEVRRGSQAVVPSWWQRMLRLQPAGRKLYLTDIGTGHAFVLGDRLIVSDNYITPMPAASAPMGWRTTGLHNEISPFSPPGQPVIAVTHLVHFDPVTREVLARVPLSMACGSSIYPPPVYTWCTWAGRLDAVDLYTGERRTVAEGEAARAAFTGNGVVPGKWRTQGRTIFMSKQVLSATEAVALDLFTVVDEPGRPGRFERLGPVPSSSVRSAQGTPWGLLLVSPSERRAWLYDSHTRNSISAPLPLSTPAGELAAISHTRDHLLVAEVASFPDGRAQTRLLVLDPRLRVLHTLELAGRTNSIVSSARPWRALNSDGPHFVIRPEEVPQAAPR